MDQHIDAVLIGPGHPLYAAVDERLNEMLAPLTAAVGVFVDTNSEVPYKLHFFGMGIKGQNTKGETQTLLGELVAVREELTNGEERFDGRREATHAGESDRKHETLWIRMASRVSDPIRQR